MVKTFLGDLFATVSSTITKNDILHFAEREGARVHRSSTPYATEYALVERTNNLSQILSEVHLEI